MKRTIIIITLLLTFAGCKKYSDTVSPSNSTDVRDKFVGNWKRIYVVVGLSATEYSENFKISKSSINSDNVLMESGYDTWQATINSDKISYTNQKSLSNSAFFSGDGTISTDGKTIKISGKESLQTTTQIYNTTEVWTKQ